MKKQFPHAKLPFFDPSLWNCRSRARMPSWKARISLRPAAVAHIDFSLSIDPRSSARGKQKRTKKNGEKTT
jgi:hypothetical protein